MTRRGSSAARRVALATGLALGLMAGASGAAQAAPRAEVEVNVPQYVNATDQHIRPYVMVHNGGDTATTDPIEISVPIPSGLTYAFAGVTDPRIVCSDAPVTVVTCTLTGELGAKEWTTIQLFTSVDPGTTGEKTFAASITGGGGTTAVLRGQPTITIADDHGPAGWRSFSAGVSADDGSPYTQAGGHPGDVTATLDFRTRTAEPFLFAATETAIEQIKDVGVDLPQGLVGDPTAVAVCSTRDFNMQGPIQQSNCPQESQVGVARLRGSIASIFNIEPPRGAAAAFGFVIQSVPVVLTAHVRSDGGYALSMGTRNAATTVSITGVQTTFWGVPADPVHDYERANCMKDTQGGPSGTACPLAGNPPLKAFLTTPTSCSTDPLPWRASFTSHESPATRRDTSSTSPQMTNCDAVPFDPQISARPTVTKADSPSGLDFELNVPFSHDPGQLSQANLRNASVLLPEGMTISPSSADGLDACRDDQLHLGTNQPATCPDASKIGSARLVTPLLNESVEGSIFLRTQASNDPASGDMFRAVIELRNDDRGLVIKLPGQIAADPATGRITASFDNNPQLPFTNLRLHFKDGPRAPLATSPVCGEKTTVATLTGWNGKTVTRTDRFTIECISQPDAFSPGFTAGGGSGKAGGATSFMMRATRADGQRAINGLTMRLPAGLLARLSSVPLCGEAEANAGTCSEASRVGTATIGAGPGSNPFYVKGGVYLTGPYKQGAFGLVVSVRVLAGPFDLGTVVVRQQLMIDRADTHVTVVSDPLPTIVGGVPIRMRTLAVDIDRPGFMLNPTSCTTSAIGATFGAEGGGSVDLTAPFKVGGCAALPFKPKMTFKVGARGHTKADVSTALEANLTMPAGNANNKSVQVTLPRTLNARLEVLNNRNACSLEQYNNERCPINVGTATAVTPLLREPLTGKAYLVRNPARRLPDMVVALKGQGDARALQIDLTGKISVLPGELTLRTTFDTIPDAPITRFQLKLHAGRKGAIGTVDNLCAAATRKASVVRLAFQGQNGRRAASDQRMTVVGCAKKAPARKAKGKKSPAKKKSARKSARR